MFLARGTSVAYLTMTIWQSFLPIYGFEPKGRESELISFCILRLADSAGQAQAVARSRPLRTVRERFPSHGSCLTTAPPDREDPQPGAEPGVFRPLADCLGGLARLGGGRFALCSRGRRPEDALSDGPRSSFALPSGSGPSFLLARFGQTDVGLSGALHPRFGLFSPLNAAPVQPALRLGQPRPAWPKTTALPCAAFDPRRVSSGSSDPPAACGLKAG